MKNLVPERPRKRESNLEHGVQNRFASRIPIWLPFVDSLMEGCFEPTLGLFAVPSTGEQMLRGEQGTLLSTVVDAEKTEDRTLWVSIVRPGNVAG